MEQTNASTKKTIKKRTAYTTKWIAYTALLTALVVATGQIPGIPVGVGKIYWCDFVIYTTAFIMDPLSAMIVGGVGTSFFDLFGINGTAYNALPSLIIHGLQGFTASLIFTMIMARFNKDESTKKEVVIAIISTIIPAIIVMVGYFLKRTFIEGSLEIAIAKTPAEILQETFGIVIALVLTYACRFKEQLKKAHLLPDFKREFIIKEDNEDNAEQQTA
jgi:uncharacterized membrane protein